MAITFLPRCVSLKKVRIYLISFAVTGAESVPYKKMLSPCVLYFSIEPTMGPRLSPMARSLPIQSTTGSSSPRTGRAA